VATIQEVVGHNIRNFRRAKGFTQERLAEMIDVHGSYVGYLERGKKSPSLNLLGKISEVLQIDPAFFFLAPPDEKSDEELKKLMVFLANKGPAPIKFINEMAIAYFRSLDEMRAEKKT
jgi:transcriptional regulator with XRE-family HTH domain